MLKKAIAWVLSVIKSRHWLSVLSCSVVVCAASITGYTTSAYGISLTNALTIPGESTDLYKPESKSANDNRLGGFFSDLYYDRSQNVYYGLSDRGPGGGVIPYNTRVEKFSLDVDKNTGAISNFKLLDTILFTKNNQNFNGLNPKLLNGNSAVLGLSHDPEGFTIASNGNFYVSDEYGPSVYEFNPNGSFKRAFTTPENLIPKVGNDPNYTDSNLTSGRQSNRGFEGVTITPDGSKLYALFQDPLIKEGSPDERSSRNLRLVEFDTKTGKSSGQYIYQLEDIADINNRIPGDADDFKSTQQGRNIGISSITALNDKEFLVLERDNRGIGVDDPTGKTPVGSKRVYKIDLTGATDVSGISLVGTNNLPSGVTPVSKSSSPFIDIANILKTSGQPIPDKLEGLAIGPQLADGSYAILVGTDNDFSVTQNDSNVQFDVCTGGTQVAIGFGCPKGQSLIPTYLYSFKASSQELKGFVPLKKVPEPTTTSGLIFLGLSAFLLKRGIRS